MASALFPHSLTTLRYCFLCFKRGDDSVYKINAQGWSKHFDFMIVDEISLQLAFFLAIFIWHHTWTYSPSPYLIVI